jgi:hypothetical protein
MKLDFGDFEVGYVTAEEGWIEESCLVGMVVDIGGVVLDFEGKGTGCRSWTTLELVCRETGQNKNRLEIVNHSAEELEWAEEGEDAQKRALDTQLVMYMDHLFVRYLHSPAGDVCSA